MTCHIIKEPEASMYGKMTVEFDDTGALVILAQHLFQNKNEIYTRGALAIEASKL